MPNQIDIAAFSPHPDDAELYCAGTLLLCKEHGYTTAIVDLSQGELSTRGTQGTRIAETQKASRLLNLDVRLNLGLPDGAIANTEEQRIAVIRALRTLRPKVVFLPYHQDRHPDHVHTHEVVKDALFLSGLAKLKTVGEDYHEQQPWRPNAAYMYMLSRDFEPAIIVDISSVQQRKMEAIRAYSTQFYTSSDSDQLQTYISTPAFLSGLTGRSQRLGFLIGGQYGEGFLPLQPQRFEVDWLLN